MLAEYVQLLAERIYVQYICPTKVWSFRKEFTEKKRQCTVKLKLPIYKISQNRNLAIEK